MLNGDQLHWLFVEIWYGLDNAPEDLGDTVVTIGVFDGIHLGHKRLIAAAVSDARARGVKSLLMTFDPNPVALFAPDKVCLLYTSPSPRDRQKSRMPSSA